MNVTEVLKAAAASWVVFLALFFILFPITAPLLLEVLRFLLEGLNNFGAGWL